MKCPKCHKELDKVWLISLCSQPYDLKEDSYGMVEVGATERKECWNCCWDVTELLKEI